MKQEGLKGAKWTHRESHPNLRFAGPASSCWTMSPSAEAVGLEPTSGFHPPPVFKTGSSSGRMTSSSCGGWNRTNALLGQSQALRTSSNCPAVCFHFRFKSRKKVRGEGIEPPSPGSKTGSLPLADPRECPAGVGPAFPAWKAGAFAARPRARCSFAAEGEGVEPSRLIARRFSKPLPSPVGLPFRKAAVTGIEPVSAP